MLGLCRQGLGRFMAVGRVELAQITGDALLKLRAAPFHLRPREVPIAIVHRLELAASIATLAFASRPMSRQSSTKRTHLADGTAIAYWNRAVIPRLRQAQSRDGFAR